MGDPWFTERCCCHCFHITAHFKEPGMSLVPDMFPGEPLVSRQDPWLLVPLQEVVREGMNPHGCKTPNVLRATPEPPSASLQHRVIKVQLSQPLPGYKGSSLL